MTISQLEVILESEVVRCPARQTWRVMETNEMPPTTEPGADG
jgi:hypothetical protein